MERSNAISLIRMCSMIMIVACHILQYYDSEMAFWLNVGVPVFLILSGFLYGQKETVSEKFYRKRLCKIMPEFWLFMTFAITAYAVILRYSFSASELARLFAGLPNRTAGLQHIWFVSTILLCYAITPLIYKSVKLWGGVKLLLAAVILCEVIAKAVPVFTGAWIFSYVFGFVLGRKKATDSQKQQYDRIWPEVCYVCVISLIVNLIKIYLLYASDVSFGHAGMVFLSRFYNYCHVCLAVTIFMGLYIIGEKIIIGQYLKRLLQFSDKYSYDVYLVHHIFLIGPFSLLKLGVIKGLTAFCLVVPILAILLQRAGGLFARLMFSLKWK